MNFKIALMLACLIVGFPSLGDEADDEEAVWNLEESYWRFVENNDVEGYLQLWDDRFVGWPSFSELPLGKANIADWIPGLHSDPSRHYEYALDRQVVRSFGDVVVVHYFVRDGFRTRGTNDLLDGATTRITHTWLRRGDTWKIITGMAAAVSGDQ